MGKEVEIFDQIHVPEFEEGITDPESRGLLE